MTGRDLAAQLDAFARGEETELGFWRDAEVEAKQDDGKQAFPDSGPFADAGANREFWRLGEVVREMDIVVSDLAEKYGRVRRCPDDAEALRDLAEAAYRAHLLVQAASGYLLAGSMAITTTTALEAQKEGNHA